MKSLIPESIRLEHEELHAELSKAIEAGGRVGPAAEEVARLLHPHFEAEEEYAMPPLGYLAILARGEEVDDPEGVAALARKLAEDLPDMLQEHRWVVNALEVLRQAAEADNKPEYVRFCEKLKLHAQNEEEILYPAAILVGKYLELTSPPGEMAERNEPALIS